MKPQAAHILAVLRDGRPHSALDFKRGLYGQRIDAVSQRVGELRREGYPVESSGRGGHNPATYRLATVPDVTTYDGALFPRGGDAAPAA
jgi:biotin operon repressor